MCGTKENMSKLPSGLKSIMKLLRIILSYEWHVLTEHVQLVITMLFKMNLSYHSYFLQIDIPKAFHSKSNIILDTGPSVPKAVTPITTARN